MKDFYKITEMSEDFRVFNERTVKEDIPLQTMVQFWQARFMLAIAQQLSIVASHLGKIVRKAEEPK